MSKLMRAVLIEISVLTSKSDKILPLRTETGIYIIGEYTIQTENE